MCRTLFSQFSAALPDMIESLVLLEGFGYIPTPMVCVIIMCIYRLTIYVYTFALFMAQGHT